MTARKATKAKPATPQIFSDVEIEVVDDDPAVRLDADPNDAPEPAVAEPAPEPAPAVEEPKPAAASAQPSLGDTILAILADERSGGRERFCVKLAIQSGMSADKVLSLAEDTAPAVAAKSLAQRAAATGVNAVASAPEVPADETKQAWAKAVKPINDRVNGH